MDSGTETGFRSVSTVSCILSYETKTSFQNHFAAESNVYTCDMPHLLVYLFMQTVEDRKFAIRRSSFCIQSSKILNI